MVVHGSGVEVCRDASWWGGCRVGHERQGGYLIVECRSRREE